MATAPSSQHTTRYHAGNVPQEDDGRLRSAVFERNSPPLIAALTPWLAGCTGPALEIGSGTGQHNAAFALAFPHLDLWPSDPDTGHQTSIAAWRRHLRLPDRDVLALDASSSWARMPDIARLGALSLVLSLNVIHIAPFAVAQGIVAGAGASLASGGLLMFYGPFKVNGAHIGDGNAAFDAGLRAENPDWGIRDTVQIESLAAEADMTFVALQAMPANNRLLIFRKS